MGARTFQPPSPSGYIFLCTSSLSLSYCGLFRSADGPVCVFFCPLLGQESCRAPRIFQMFVPNFAPSFSGICDDLPCFVPGKRRPLKIHPNSPPFERKQKGGFVKGRFWRMCPRSGFFGTVVRFLYALSGFWCSRSVLCALILVLGVRGTSFGNHPFANPRAIFQCRILMQTQKKIPKSFLESRQSNL